MQTLITEFENKYRKEEIPEVRSGDTVRVHQRITEGSKERVQIFEGVVIRTHRKNSLSANITVRRNTGGIGVEKSFMLHAPNTEKVEVMRSGRVRRNYLAYMRGRSGKSARIRERDMSGKAATKSKASTAKKTSKKSTAKK